MNITILILLLFMPLAILRAQLMDSPTTGPDQTASIIGKIVQVVDEGQGFKGYMVNACAAYGTYRIVLVVTKDMNLVDGDSFADYSRGDGSGHAFECYSAGTITYTDVMGAQRTVRVFAPDRVIAERLRNRNN